MTSYCTFMKYLPTSGQCKLINQIIPQIKELCSDWFIEINRHLYKWISPQINRKKFLIVVLAWDRLQKKTIILIETTSLETLKKIHVHIVRICSQIWKCIVKDILQDCEFYLPWCVILESEKHWKVLKFWQSSFGFMGLA